MKRRKQILFAGVILLTAALIALLMYLFQPSLEREELPERATAVEVSRVELISEPITITAYGTVQGNREVSVQPEVGGRVVELSPNLVLGGLFKKGEMLLKIDPTDYLNVIEQEKAAVEKGELDLKVEEGRQVVAEREWKLLNPELKKTELSRELVLREQHYKEKQAALKAAKSRLAKAQYDLKRTILTAPFNAVAVEENVEVGQLIAPQTTVARLVATDEFRVQLNVPLEQLKWIDLSEGPISATIIQETEKSRKGEVVRLLPDLDPSGRVAKLLVLVSDPLGLKEKKPPLLIGTFVRVDIQGPLLEGVFKVPSEALRGQSEIWIMNGDRRLDIREIDIVYSTEDHVIIKNRLKDGDRVVVSPIPVPIEGMLLTDE